MMSDDVKVFGCRPMMTAPRTPGAGVRKPLREETAGGRARWRVRRYGDFVAGGVMRLARARFRWRPQPRRVPHRRSISTRRSSIRSLALKDRQPAAVYQFAVTRRDPV